MTNQLLQPDLIDEILDNANEFCQTNSQDLLFTTAKPARTSANKLSTFTKVRLSNLSVECNLKLSHYFEGITMFDYINSNRMFKFESENWLKLGRVCNQLFRFLRTQCHLKERLKSVRSSFVWQLMTCERHLKRNLDKLFVKGETQQKRDLVEKVLDEFERVSGNLSERPEHIQHGDLCNRNILAKLRARKEGGDEVEKYCIVDFQDLQVGPQVLDLSMMMLYGALEQELVPLELALRHIPHWLYKGYQQTASSSCSLEEQELSFAPTLIKLRLCQSLLNGLVAAANLPDDAQKLYVLHTNQRGWQLLELMLNFANETLVGWWRDGP